MIDGNIPCPYHGWVFNTEGVCVSVPQLANGLIPRTYKVQSYRCTECYGYVWVCLDEPLDGIPEFPEATDPVFRLIHQFYEPWRCSGLRIMENSFDIAHPHFVHATSFGDQQNPVSPAMDFIEETENGIHVKYSLPVLNPAIQQKNLGIAEATTIRTTDRIWYMPFTRKLSITYLNGLNHVIVTIATPISDSTSQLVQFCLRNDKEEQASARDVIAFDRTVTLEDKAVLETTDYDTPLNIHEEQHMVSDKPNISMRHKLFALLKAHGEVEQRQEVN